RKSEKVLYGLQALNFAASLKPSPSMREIALIGSGAVAGEILIAMDEWLKESRSRMFIISHESSPLDAFLEKANSETKEKLMKLFREIDEEFETDIETFTRKLREWQELDDFVQVKI